jgi:hypothetical protein
MDNGYYLFVMLLASNDAANRVEKRTPCNDVEIILSETWSQNNTPTLRPLKDK